MKLEKELSETVRRLQLLGTETILAHVEHLRANEYYKNLETRAHWDSFKAIYKAAEVSKLYDRYKCNDTHIDTLIRRAFKELNINIEHTPTKQTSPLVKL